MPDLRVVPNVQSFVTDPAPQPNRWIANLVLVVAEMASLSDDEFMESRLYPAFRHLRPTVGLAGRGFRMVFDVEASGLDQARDSVDESLAAIRAATGLKFELDEFSLIPASRVDAAFTELPNCVGVGEAAEILGVSKQRVVQLAKKPQFPASVFTLRATPVWRESDIRRFAMSRSQSAPAS